jgi:hypothetical protein
LTIGSGDLQRLAPLKKTAKELRESKNIEKPCATTLAQGFFTLEIVPGVLATGQLGGRE